MFVIPPGTCSSENVTNIVKIFALQSMVNIMITDVGWKETQEIRLDAVIILPVKCAGHAMKQTVAIAGDTDNPKMFSRVVVNESVPRGLDLRSRVGSFADSTVRRFPMGKRRYDWRLTAQFMKAACK